jgi:hypothetical protein
MAHPEDDALIREIQGRTTNTSDAGVLYQREIQQLASSGVLWAQDVQRRAELQGYRYLYTSGLRRITGAFMVTRDRVQRKVRRMFARPERRPDGTRTGAFQLDFWMDCTWDEIDQLIHRQQRQADQLETNIAVLNYVVRDLQPRAPQAKTPAEACGLLGWDLQEYLASVRDL